MPGAPLTSTEGLGIGDVLQCAIKLRSKHNGEEYWWKTFRAVLEITFPGYARLLILKMHPDLDKDIRDEQINFTAERVFVKLEEHEMPQGVLAMRMKHTATGLIVPF